MPTRQYDGGKDMRTWRWSGTCSVIGSSYVQSVGGRAWDCTATSRVTRNTPLGASLVGRPVFGGRIAVFHILLRGARSIVWYPDLDCLWVVWS